ncbi:class III lanthionine synthetase LanKC [Bacillus toyonensis]|uniref:class III lanthionine synthetase LanKC n=1 Tax=Bacillus toyonensis TaxID=155322 RepID=UPI001C54D747|nr:class III lanthionine synthetase LanKC [Bacillus toyonensis]
MDVRYLDFLKKDALFYEAMTMEKSGNYTVPKLDESEWKQEDDMHWNYCINLQNKMPKQGWKIHISTHLDFAQNTLDSVVPYLLDKKISFKYVPNEKTLLSKNSKYGDRAASGKFITIYPNNQSSFLRILVEIEQLISDLPKGAYILNDKRWNNSNLYFRYGGFAPMYVNKDGINVLAIETPDGHLIPDNRSPYYEVPNFIKEPDEIQKMSKQMEHEIEQEDTSKFDAYEVTSALHFSNGGGVYKVKKDSKYYVMKEGRPGSGLDGLKRDGFNRLKNEAEILYKLNKENNVVDIYDYFEIWENNYLIEEFLEGKDIADYVAQNFPFSYKQDRKSYAEKMLRVIDQIEELIKNIHKENIAIGDLQPNNIVILEDGTIKLIDLETATTPKQKYQPGLMTPGFISKNAKTFEEADWFALMRISRFLFLPIEPVADLTDEIEINQNKWIESYFGTAVTNKLEEIKEHTKSLMNLKINNSHMLSIPPIEISLENKELIIQELRKGIINSLNINSETLINGDIRQFIEKLGGLTVATGGFGGIMALERTGGIPKEVFSWIDKNVDEYLNIEKVDLNELPLGLFTGLSGIISVLFDIGYEEKALELLKNINVDELNKSDLTLYSGLSGIGLNYLSFYTITKDPYFLETSKKISSILIDIYKNNGAISVLDPFAMPQGLLNGWSGVSLFLLQLGVTCDDKELLKISKEILNKEINENIQIDQTLELAQVFDSSMGKGRLVPYLGEGAAGVALVMMEFQKYFKDFKQGDNSKLLLQLSNVAELFCTYTNGILRGSAGMIILSNAKENNHYSTESLKHTVGMLKNYLLYKEDIGILSPGDYGYRCSLDFQTGNSGILLALCDIHKNKWNSWLPLPKNNTLNLFQN